MMHGSPGPTHAPDAAAAAGLRTGSEFLRGAHRSAIRRFRDDGTAIACHTVGLAWPASPESGGRGGAVFLHVGPALFAAWSRAADGAPAKRQEHVVGQLHLVLRDLAGHSLACDPAPSEAERAAHGDDVAQLVAESLGRTTFGRLGLRPEAHWEGTSAEGEPAGQVLVASVGLAPQEGPR